MSVVEMFAQFIMVCFPGEGDLNELLRATMYVVILDNLFGVNVLPTESEVIKLFSHSLQETSLAPSLFY